MIKITKHLFAIILAIISVSSSFSQNEQWLSAYNFGTSADDEFITGSVKDYDGNTYVCGFRNTGGKPFMIVAKYDLTGQLLWSDISATESRANDIVADENGGIFVTGYFVGNISFLGNGPLVAVNGGADQDIFTVKYTTEGQVDWYVGQGSNSAFDQGIALDVNNAGDVWVLVNIGNGSTDIGNPYPAGLLHNGNLVIKYNWNGNYDWAKTIDFDAYCQDITVDDNQNMYLAGSFSWAVAVDAVNLNGSGGTQDAFVIKFNNSGPPTATWGAEANGAGNDQGVKVAVDNASNVYLTGNFDGSINFLDAGAGAGGTLVTGNGNRDVFLTKYNFLGGVTWARNIGSSSDDYVFDMDFDKDNNPVLAGTMNNTIDFASQTLTCCGSFLASFDINGNESWGTGMNAEVADIAMGDNRNTVYAAGNFWNSADFGSISLDVGVSGYDYFIARYGIPPDLAIQSQTPMPGQATPGQFVYIRGYIENRSNDPGIQEDDMSIAPGSAIDIYLSDNTVLDGGDALLGSIQAGPIDPGSGNSFGGLVQIPGGTAVGEYYIIYEADPNNNIIELDETNNIETEDNNDGKFYIVSPQSSGTLNYTWVEAPTGGGNNFVGVDVVVDNNDEAIVVGNFMNSANFGANILSSGVDQAVFGVRYDVTGSDNHAFSGTTISTGNVSAVSVAVTNTSGRVFLSGDFREEVRFASSLLDPTAVGAGYFYGHNASGGGVEMWLNKTSPVAVQMNSKGMYKDPFDGNSLITAESDGVSSTLRRVQSGGTSNFLYSANFIVQNLAVSPSNGDIYIVGHFTDPFFFNGQIYASQGGEDGFVAKIQSDGLEHWIRIYGGVNDDRITEVEVDDNGNVYIAGEFEGSANYGGVEVSNTTSTTDLFVASISSGGDLDWILNYGSTNDRESLTDLGIHSDRGIYVLGNFEGNIDIGFMQLSSGSNSSAYLFRVGPDNGGILDWAVDIGTEYVEAHGIAFDSNDDIYITGGHKGSNNFGSFNHATGGASDMDMFLAKIGESPDLGVDLQFSGISPAIVKSEDTVYYSAVIENEGNIDVLQTSELGVYLSDDQIFDGSDTELTTVTIPSILQGENHVSQGYFVIPQASNDGIKYVIFRANYDLGLAESKLNNNSVAVKMTIDNSYSKSSHITWKWTKGINDTFAAYGVYLDTDANGNIYSMGKYGFNADFGGLILAGAPPGEGLNTYVSKYDSSGNVQWANQITGDDYVEVTGMLTDNYGNTYISGHYRGTLSFVNSGDFPSSGGTNDLYLVKYDKDGEDVWVQRIGDSGSEEGGGLALGNDGGLYMTGGFEGSVMFGAAPLASDGNLDLFIAKYDTANGNVIWVRKGGGAVGNDSGHNMVASSNGGVYLYGKFTDQMTLESSNPSNNIIVDNSGSATEDLFIAEYSDTGELTWAVNLNGVGMKEDDGIFTSFHINTDSNGDVYVTGSFEGVGSTLSGTLLNWVGDLDFFVAKYDGSDGSLIWVRPFGAEGEDNVFNLQLDSDDMIHFSGYYGSDLFDVGGTQLISSGNLEYFYAKYDSDGIMVAATGDGGSAIEAVGGMHIDANDNIYSTGAFGVSIAFDTTRLFSTGLLSGFINKGVSPNIPQIPNLVIDNLSIDVSSIIEEQDVEVTVDYSNNGFDDVNDFFTIAVYISEDTLDYLGTSSYSAQLGTIQISPSLLEGESLQEVNTFPIPSGIIPADYYIIAVIDFLDEITEGDENDNTNNSPITVVEDLNKPDLALTNFSADNTIAAGEMLEINYDVSNLGVDITDDLYIHYFLSDSTINDFSSITINESLNGNGYNISSLDSNDVVNVQDSILIPTNTTLGTWNVYLYVDLEDLYDELTIINNVALLQIEIEALDTVITPTTGSPTDTLEIISSSFPTYYIPGNGDKVSVVLSNNEIIQSVTLYYRPIESTGTWGTITMSESGVQGGGELYEVSFDDMNNLGSLGVEYYLEIEDTSSNVFSTINSMNNTHIEFDQKDEPTLPSLKFGTEVNSYQIVAVPYVLDDKDVSDVFSSLMPYDDTKWRLFSYNATDQQTEEMSTTSDIEAGSGYWLIVKDQTTINLGTGTTVSATKNDPFEIILKPGWNMIGNPYNFDISWADVMTFNGDPADVDDDLITFNDGLVDDTDILSRYRGGFVNNTGNSDITLQLEPKETSGTNRLLKDEGYDWFLPIDVNAGGLTYGLGAVGMHEEAEYGKDKYDGETAPRFVSYVEMSVDHQDLKLSKDIVPLRDNYTWEIDVETNMGGSVSLTWDPSLLDSRKDIWLLDSDNDRIVDMSEETTYNYQSANNKSLRLLYGDDDYLLREASKGSIKVMNGYPNPFTDQTVIPFVLPNEDNTYKLEVTVYNPMGSVLNTISKTYEGGFHQLIWDGTDRNGDDLPKGSYYLNFSINSDNQYFNQSLNIIIY